MTDPQKAEQAAFALSQEELYVLLSYLKAPTPIELDDLEAQIFQGMPSDQKVTLLRAVERCLLARECLRLNADRTLSVHPSVAQAVQVCASPERSWFVLHRRRGEEATVHCFHRRAELFVLLTKPLAGMHHFVVFADDGFMRQTASDLIAAGAAKAVACAPGTMPTEVLGALTDPSQPLERAAVAAKLAKAGLTPDTAEHFAQSMEGLQSITILTRIVHVAGKKPTPEVNVTVVADGSTLWLLAQESADRLAVGSVGAEDVPAIIRGVIGAPKPSGQGN
jgi:hypothetical protein